MSGRNRSRKNSCKTSKRQPNIQTVATFSKDWAGDVLPRFISGKPQFIVQHFVFKPRDKTPIHLHPVNSVIYILSGQLTLRATKDPNGSFSDPKLVKKGTFGPGEVFAESVNTWHYGSNEGNEDAVFIMIFCGEAGVPITISLDDFLMGRMGI